METFQTQKIAWQDFDQVNASIINNAIKQLNSASKSKKIKNTTAIKEKRIAPVTIPDNFLRMELIDVNRIKPPFSGRLSYLFDAYPAVKYDISNSRWLTADNIYAILSNSQHRDGILSLAAVAGAKGQIAWPTTKEFEGWGGLHVQTGPVCTFQELIRVENDSNIIRKIKVAAKVKIDWNDPQLPHLVLEPGQAPNDGLVWALGHIGLSLHYNQDSNLPSLNAPIQESLLFSRLSRSVDREAYGPQFSEVTVINELLVDGPGDLVISLWPILNCIMYKSFPTIAPGEDAICMIDFRTDRFDRPITEEFKKAPGGITIEDFAIEIYGLPKIEIEGPVIRH